MRQKETIVVIYCHTTLFRGHWRSRKVETTKYGEKS